MAKAKPKPKAKKPKRTTAKAAPKRTTARTPAAKPDPASRKQRAPTSPGGTVIRILDEPDPREALRELLANIDGIATVQEAQIALGAAQLMVASVDRGSEQALDLIDLIVSHWHLFPDTQGGHAQEFLRNAFAAVGDDREVIAHLATLVPIAASPELRFNMACAYAVAGERLAMLRELEAAFAVGITPAQVLRERDFAAYADDAQLQAILDRAAAPPSAVEIEPQSHQKR